MSKPTLTLPVDPALAPRIRAVLAAADFHLEEAPHAFFRGRGPGCVATLYRSGKLVLQGPNAQTLAAVLGLAEPTLPEPAAPAAAGFARALDAHPDPKPQAWIGSDEVGKGDYFGPLVVVAARVERKAVDLLAELGVADSKRLTDAHMARIAADLDAVVAHESVVIGPEAYNRLHAKMGNLNHLLAWAHARAIENLLSAHPADFVLVDRFADDRVLRKRLLPRARAVRLEQRPKAESDPAVAAASILARVAFLDQMRALSRRAGFTLPRGAGPPVLAAAKRLVAARGPESLRQFAKVHFRTTAQVLGAPLPAVS